MKLVTRMRACLSLHKRPRGRLRDEYVPDVRALHRRSGSPLFSLARIKREATYNEPWLRRDKLSDLEQAADNVNGVPDPRRKSRYIIHFPFQFRDVSRPLLAVLHILRAIF